MPDDDSGLTGQFARYPELFADLKARIRSAQVRAALSVDRALCEPRAGSPLLADSERNSCALGVRGIKR